MFIVTHNRVIQAADAGRHDIHNVIASENTLCSQASY